MAERTEYAHDLERMEGEVPSAVLETAHPGSVMHVSCWDTVRVACGTPLTRSETWAARPEQVTCPECLRFVREIVCG